MIETSEALIEQHKAEKDASTKFKERRFTQWNDNYTLFRDKVSTNRLTQRQPVNIPIIRDSIQNWISKIDEPPMLKFETRGRGETDKSGQIVLNELWDYHYDKLKLDLVDNMEKKIVGLQGRAFKKWGWSKGEIFCDLIDPYDIDIDPRANPLDIEGTAHSIIHKNIFRPLRAILANPKFDEAGKTELKVYLDSKQGLLKAAETNDEYERRKERLTLLGVTNYDEFRAADVMVELNESYKMIWVEADKAFVRHLVIIAADKVVLFVKPVREASGINRSPIVSWASDPDLNDLWSDGIADNVRTFNKVVNMYISGDLENRAYRNFGMYFFNTLNGQFQPQAFNPKPFGMYGVPGNPDEIVKQMRIEPLNDTAQQITFLKDLIQSSVAQTPTERGVQDKSNATLGEVQLNLQQSQNRNQVVSKHYRRAWKESGELFYALLNANAKQPIKLYKRNANGDYYAKDVNPSDWQNKDGYECKVVLKEEKDSQDTLDLQKLHYIMGTFANNPAALKIARRKELELLDWEQPDIDAVMQAEEAQTVMPTAAPALPAQLTTQNA